MKDVLNHKKIVKQLCSWLILRLAERTEVHDDSKLQTPEKELFDKYSGKLSTLVYGSSEYFENLKKLQPAIDHHYKMNSHHPEHHENGIDGMTLIDVVEMWADWLAAARRGKDGSIRESLEINRKRFKMSDQLYNIMLNTYKQYLNL